MNTDKLIINHKINQLKGLIHNIDLHQRYSLVDSFLKFNQDYFNYFEQSEALSFGITHTKHSKILTEIFLSHGYDTNKDPAIFKAVQMKKFKSAKIILKNGFNINSNFHNKNILTEILKLIHNDKSNTTLRKINNLLYSINILDLDLNSTHIIKDQLIQAHKKIQEMYENHPQLTLDIKESFSEFKNRLELVEKQRQLDKHLVEKSIQTPKRMNKI